jgi:hypothetical protein
MKKLSILLATFALAASSQAAIVQLYDLRGTAGFGLLAANEPSLPFATNASGGEIADPTPGNPFGIYLSDGNDADPNTNLLTLNVGWGSSRGFTDLSSTATASHLHGPTAANNGSGFTQTAGVANIPGLGGTANLARSSSAVTGGTFTNAPFNLTAAEVTNLNNGKYYINIHTSNNTGGEIRGFIVPVPEPTSAALLGAASLVVLGRRRRS